MTKKSTPKALIAPFLLSLSCISLVTPVPGRTSFKAVYRAMAEARSVAASEDPIAASIPVQESAEVRLAVVKFTKDNRPVAIHFNPVAMSRLPYSAMVGIFAHEWGHALTGDPSQLRADRWAGCTLAVLWLDIDPFVDVLKNQVVDTRDADLRGYVIESGFSDCPGLVGIKP